MPLCIKLVFYFAIVSTTALVLLPAHFMCFLPSHCGQVFAVLALSLTPSREAWEMPIKQASRQQSPAFKGAQ